MKRHHLDVPQATELVYRLNAAELPALPARRSMSCECVAAIGAYLKEKGSPSPPAEPSPARRGGCLSRGFTRGRITRPTPGSGGIHMAILETKNLTYTYGAGTPFEKTAVQNVSIAVERASLSA